MQSYIKFARYCIGRIKIFIFPLIEKVLETVCFVVRECSIHSLLALCLPPVGGSYTAFSYFVYSLFMFRLLSVCDKFSRKLVLKGYKNA